MRVGLPLAQGARLRVSLDERGVELPLCGIMPAEGGLTALEWTSESLSAGDDAGANVCVRQAPFVRGVHLVGTVGLDGLPGFLADSLPDAWGRLLVDRQVRKSGILPQSLRGFDRLAIVGPRGAGALVFAPEVPLAPERGEELDLDQLLRGAEAILAGEESPVLEQLERVGGSAGGSRPKAWIAVDASGRIRSGAHALAEGESGWLVKFRAPRHDPEDIGPLEFAYAKMAMAAGLEVPEPRLFETSRGRYFAGRRFDRDGTRRIHVLTAAGLLNVSAEQALATDYIDLLALTRHLTRSEAEVLAAYRHAAFNVLAHNRDDHLKQFAFVRHDGAWRRAPAYDLTYQQGPGGEHTLLVAGEGRHPGSGELHELARRSGLRERAARRVLDEVRDAVSRWGAFAAEAGVGVMSTRQISDAIRANGK